MRIRIQDPESFGRGSGMEKFSSRIRDKHPGSATLVFLSDTRIVITREKFRLKCRYIMIVSIQRWMVQYMVHEVKITVSHAMFEKSVYGT
jgi:hypothetical protein